MVVLELFRYVIKFLSYICYVLIGVYFLISFPVFIGYTPLIVLSGSMTPTFGVGDVIYYEKVEPERIKIDDVITFESGKDAFVTHRISNIIDGQYETRGDANLSPDSNLVDYKSIKGKVIEFKLPKLGYYVKYINNHLYLVIIAVVILISEFIIDNMKTFDIKKNKRKEFEV